MIFSIIQARWGVETIGLESHVADVNPVCE